VTNKVNVVVTGVEAWAEVFVIELAWARISRVARCQWAVLGGLMSRQHFDGHGAAHNGVSA